MLGTQQTLLQNFVWKFIALIIDLQINLQQYSLPKLWKKKFRSPSCEALFEEWKKTVS